MNDQSTATDTSAEPKLCQMGCGFFGSNATGDCCSKCWNSRQKKDENSGSAIDSNASTAMEVDAMQCSPVSVETPAVTESVSAAPVVSVAEAPVEEAAVVEKKSPKKKKKKSSYKSMMAGMTQRSKDASSLETDKANLRKVTGGGAFIKVDKI